MNTTIKPSVGVGTVLGTILTIAGSVGTVIAAVQANDVATVTAGAAAVFAGVTTLGGRFAQAVAIARNVAPFVGAVNAALEGTKGDTSQP